MRKPQWKLDHEAIEASGHNLESAMAFFQKRGMSLARHPKHGWQFLAVLATSVPGTCAYWHRVIGTVESLIETLDTPSAVLRELKAKQDQAMARY